MNRSISGGSDDSATNQNARVLGRTAPDIDKRPLAFEVAAHSFA
jgi:hypothetical protein